MPDPQRSGGGPREPGELARVRPGGLPADPFDLALIVSDGGDPAVLRAVIEQRLADHTAALARAAPGVRRTARAARAHRRRGAAGLALPWPGRLGRVAAPAAAAGLTLLQVGGATVHVRRGEHRTLPVNAVLLALAAHVALSARR